MFTGRKILQLKNIETITQHNTQYTKFFLFVDAIYLLTYFKLQ